VKRSTMKVAAVAAVLAIGLAACGDDDGDEASSEAAGATTTTAAAGLAPEACEAYLDLAGAVGEVPEGPDAGAFIESDVLPAIEAIEANGNEATAEPAATMLEIATAAVEDPAQFDDPAAQAAFSDVGGVVHSDCGYEAVDVSGIDYAFEGVPDSLAAGPTSFAFTNDGTEEHEMVMFRLADGETRPIEELLALPEAEAEEAVTFTGATFSPIGETTYAVADLEAGSYAAVCFIPVGGAEDGPPHFTEGMIAEFEVS
jgi:hypothetical protein